mmetsp:Transcript_10687/g.16047  ORF Transcript_10687/g.16047 Transcript_10687/m.16047 type:complete len:202 (+) Transcript_10687:100-705(+)
MRIIQLLNIFTVAACCCCCCFRFLRRALLAKHILILIEMRALGTLPHALRHLLQITNLLHIHLLSLLRRLHFRFEQLFRDRALLFHFRWHMRVFLIGEHNQVLQLVRHTFNSIDVDSFVIAKKRFRLLNLNLTRQHLRRHQIRLQQMLDIVINLALILALRHLLLFTRHLLRLLHMIQHIKLGFIRVWVHDKHQRHMTAFP